MGLFLTIYLIFMLVYIFTFKEEFSNINLGKVILVVVCIIMVVNLHNVVLTINKLLAYVANTGVFREFAK